MSGDWLCRGVDVCLSHCHPLVPLWTKARPFDRDNVGARLEELLPDLRAGRFESDRVTPSAYDLWLDRRLSPGLDETWLAGQPLFAAMTFCLLLGNELLRVDGAETQERAAKAWGFEVARQGPAAIRQALGRLTRTDDGGHSVTRNAFGGLFDAMAVLYRDDSSFDGFRDILRDHLTDIWPVGAGETILGQPLPERRLHSLATASKATGMGPTVLNSFLTEAGAFPAGDTRADARKLFDARRFAPLIKEIPTLVGPAALRMAMGATRTELNALDAEGILIPRTRVPTIKSRWRLSDGLALVEELNRLAIPVAGKDHRWETIQLAYKRTGLSVGRVIGAIREGTVTVGKRTDVEGYHGLVVECRAVNRLMERADLTSHVPLEGEMNVSAFAREIGLRKKGAFLGLIAAGHVTASEIVNPMTKRPQLRMIARDIEDFHAKFTTPTLMAQRSGLHRNTILAALAARDAKPFRPNGEDFGAVYLREDVDPILQDISLSR